MLSFNVTIIKKKKKKNIWYYLWITREETKLFHSNTFDRTDKKRLFKNHASQKKREDP